MPHVAYFFRGFEPINDGLDQFWWYVAYAIAGVIDLTVLLMTWAESKMAREHKPLWPMRSFVWLFIGLATATEAASGEQRELEGSHEIPLR